MRIFGIFFMRCRTTVNHLEIIPRYASEVETEVEEVTQGICDV